MNLKSLFFLGHNLTKANFEIIKEQTGRGYFNYSIEPSEDAYLVEKKQEDKILERQLCFDVKSKVEGFENETEESVFNLEIEFSLAFSIEDGSEIDVEKEFSNKYEWFMMNFAAVSAKEISQSIINQTPMRALMLPSHRSLEENPQ